MKQIPYTSYDELPDDVESFSDPEKLILVISPEVVFPLREREHDFRFKTNDLYMPYNYRLKFLHPSLYYSDAFTADSRKKIDTLRQLAKRGATIVFIVDSTKDNSLINACCLLAECFSDCRNAGMTLTNIPFPVKKEKEEPHNWIWSCYWDEHFPERLDEAQSKEFIREIRFDFPEYDDATFSVRVIAQCKEKNGIIAFSVKVGNGKVFVVTPNTKGFSIKSEESTEPIKDEALVLFHPKSAVPDIPSTKVEKGEAATDTTKIAATPQLNITISKPEEREKFAIEVGGETRYSTLRQVLKFLAIYASTIQKAHFLFQNKVKVIVRKGKTPSEGEFDIKCLYGGIRNVSGDINEIFEIFLPKKPDLNNYIERTESGRFQKFSGCQNVILKNIHVTLDTDTKNAIDTELSKVSIPSGLKQFILDALR